MAKKSTAPLVEKRVTTPVSGYTGVSAGVQFVDGQATVSDPYLLAWFEQHGYKVDDIVPADPPADPPVDPPTGSK